MKENLYITISDIKGSKHYTFNQIIKKYILFFCLSILLAFLILGSTIFFLRYKSAQYNEIVETKTIEYNNLKEENIKLTNSVETIVEDINTRQMELDNLNEKLKTVEGIINSDATGDMDIDERMDIALLTASEREYLLNAIPNGNPIEPFEKYTSYFGSRVHPTLKTVKNHWGLDFRAAVGTQLIAPAQGTVKFAGVNSSFGNLIIISHNYGFETYYAHLSKIDVKVGDIVSKGQKIGKTGNTGRSSGPHLHYEIHYLDKKLDPLNFAKWNIEDYNTLFEKEKNIQWQSLISQIRNQYKIFQLKEQQQSQAEQQSEETLIQKQI